MISFALAFVCGAWLLQQTPALPPAFWAVALLPLAWFSYSARSRWPGLSWPSICLLGVLCGFFWSAALAGHRLAQQLPSAWEGQDIQLIGVVASMPQQQERGERFDFDVEQLLTTPDLTVAASKFPQRISLSNYYDGFARNDGFAVRAAQTGMETPAVNRHAQDFHAGERWRLTVRLKRPHGTANPYTFDFEAWALERNIRATGYVRKNTQNQRLQAQVLRPAYVVEMLRERIRTRMRQVLAGKPYAGVLQALAIGDESGIAQHDWQIYLRTGTNHLMSISGLHITMLSGFAFALCYAGWRRSERLTLLLPARKAAVLAGALVALLYALIAGFSVPTQRTLYMLSVFAWALWTGRHVGLLRVLSYALLLVVLLDPWAVLAPGFWLSFGAVAVIGYAVAGRLQTGHWLATAVKTQWAVSLGLLPLLLVLFQQVSVSAPLANAIAIPLVSLVVVPLTLLGALLPIDFALHLAHAAMAGCMQFLQWLAAFPLSTWQQHAPPLWSLPLALLGVLVLLLPRGIPLRWMGLLALLPMLLVTPLRPQLGGMQVTVLDVGQGLAVLVQTQQHNLLYDTGPQYSSQSDSGSKIIVPFLRASGVLRLDGMVVSHNDNDHSGGMASVLSQIDTRWLLSSLPTAALADALPLAPAISSKPCVAGQGWVWDDVQFEMLYPSAQSYQNTAIKDNNRSCVLRISSRYGRLLLVGDIEKQAENELLQLQADSQVASQLSPSPNMLAADVLVVPHHGSKTSSTPAFIDAVNPSAAIFTVGYRNRFHHPRPDIVARYAERDAALYQSDRDGALMLDFAPSASAAGSIHILRWRQQYRRYWQD